VRAAQRAAQRLRCGGATRACAGGRRERLRGDAVLLRIPPAAAAGVVAHHDLLGCKSLGAPHACARGPAERRSAVEGGARCRHLHICVDAAVQRGRMYLFEVGAASGHEDRQPLPTRAVRIGRRRQGRYAQPGRSGSASARSDVKAACANAGCLQAQERSWRAHARAHACIRPARMTRPWPARTQLQDLSSAGAV